MEKSIEIDVASKREISLEIWPNPAIDSIIFVFGDKNPSWAEIDIFTVSGDKIADLRLNSISRFNSLTWPARNGNGNLIASGIYIAHLTTPSGSKTAKFAFIKN